MKCIGGAAVMALLGSLLALTMSPAIGMVPGVIHVDLNAAPGGDGSTWALAYDDLQLALGAAVSGDSIWVAQGTYTAGSNRADTFVLPDGVELLGGFENGDALLDRDPPGHETILSGDIGVAADPADNTYNIVTISNLVSAATIDGFTITGAQADGTGDELGGGGIRIEGGDVTLANLFFTENYAEFEGSAVAVTGNSSASAKIIDTRLFENIGPSIVSVRSGEELELRRVRFLDNTGTFTEDDEGAITRTGPSRAVYANGQLTMVDSRVVGQRGTTSFAGTGAVAVAGSSARIVNSEFVAAIGGPGAGLRVDSGSGPFGNDASVELANVLIANNHTAAAEGGGIYARGRSNGVDESTVSITADNVTLAYNLSNFCCPVSVGSEIYLDATMNVAGTEKLVSATFDNSIVWNTHEWVPGTPSSIFETVPLPATWRNSIVVQSNGSGAGWNGDVGIDGGGNIDADPLFVDAQFGIDRRDDDHRLKAGSPAIDGGVDAHLPLDLADVDEDADEVEVLPLDLDGAERVRGLSVDMGAYERASSFDGLTVLDEPCVVYDSRDVPNPNPGGRLSGGGVGTVVQVSGSLVDQGGASSCVPSGATAGVFRISAVDPITEGNLLMTPAGVSATGEAGVVNYGDSNGLDNANTVTVPLSAAGAVEIAVNTGPAGPVLSTVVRLVVIGYYSPDVEPDLKYLPLNPCPVADSRVNQGANGTFDGPNDDGLWPVGSAFPDVDVAGTFPAGQGGGQTDCGVPTSADAVLLNVVAVNMVGGSGHLSVGPGGTDPIDEATTPFAVLAPKMNNGATTIVNLIGSGKVSIDIDGDVGASTMIRVEVLGYFDDDPVGLDYTAVTPCAVFDSRTNQGALGSFAGERQHGVIHTTTYQVAGDDITTDQGGVVDAGGGVGSCAVPDDAEAVLINLEAVNALIEGNFWVSAAGTTTTGGVLNFNNVVPKMNNANAVVVPLNANGELALEVNAGSFTSVGRDVAHARGVIYGYYN